MTEGRTANYRSKGTHSFGVAAVGGAGGSWLLPQGLGQPSGTKEAPPVPRGPEDSPPSACAPHQHPRKTVNWLHL